MSEPDYPRGVAPSGSRSHLAPGARLAHLSCDQCGKPITAGNRWLRYSAVENGTKRYNLNFCSKQCGDAYERTHPRHAHP